MRIHTFSVDLAAKIGLIEAIILQNFYYWHQANAINEKMIIDGHVWIFQSVASLNEVFPYLSQSKIRGAIQRLINSGYLLVGNYNKAKFDRTKWYSISDETLELYASQPICENRKSKCRKSQIEVSKLTNDSLKSQTICENRKPFVKIANLYNNIESNNIETNNNTNTGDRSKMNDPAAGISNDSNQTVTNCHGLDKEKGCAEKEKSWRDDFGIYLQQCREAWTKWTKDEAWMTERRKFNPNVNIKLTLEKACKEFWATEAGWKHKKKSRSNEIDWKRTFETAISQKTNRIYEQQPAAPFKCAEHYEQF